jgi:hypothetical protein
MQIFPPVPVPNELIFDNVINRTAHTALPADSSTLLIDLTRSSSSGNVSMVTSDNNKLVIDLSSSDSDASPAGSFTVSLIDLTGSLDDVSMFASDDGDLVIDLASSDSDGDEK